MSKTIVIIGVTGIQGSSVAKTFLCLPDWKVRGITRNPSGAAAQAHAANGVEILKGDLDDKESLSPAFEGATVIFSNTDFFAHFWTALASTSIPQDGTAPNKYAYDRELEQGVNIAEVAASPTVLKTLELFVPSSLSDARKWSRGKYTQAFHNEVKADITKTIQTRFPELAARMSTVQIGHYVTNWKQSPALVPKKQPDGSFIVQRTFAPEYEMPFVVEHEDTGAFVKALVDLPPGANILGVSEFLTWPEWTRLWGEVLGVKATFKHVSADEFFHGAPGPMKKEFEETFAFVEEFGFTGGDPDVVTLGQLGIKIPLTSVEQYIRSEDWSSVL